MRYQLSPRKPKKYAWFRAGNIGKTVTLICIERSLFFRRRFERALAIIARFAPQCTIDTDSNWSNFNLS